MSESIFRKMDEESAAKLSPVTEWPSEITEMVTTLASLFGGLIGTTENRDGVIDGIQDNIDGLMDTDEAIVRKLMVLHDRIRRVEVYLGLTPGALDQIPLDWREWPSAHAYCAHARTKAARAACRKLRRTA